MYLALVLASFLLNLFSIALIKQGFSQQLLDIPNEQSSYAQLTPRGRGLGFIIAFAITGLIAPLWPSNLTQPLYNQQADYNSNLLWLILISLAIIGIIDDQRGVPTGRQHLVQLTVASIAIAFFGSFPQPCFTSKGTGGIYGAIALIVIGMAAIINFYNFMDGLDGLVAGVTAVQLSLDRRLQQSGWSRAQVATIYISVTFLLANSISPIGSGGAWVSFVCSTSAIIVGEPYLGWQSTPNRSPTSPISRFKRKKARRLKLRKQNARSDNHRVISSSLELTSFQHTTAFAVQPGLLITQRIL